MPWRYSQGSADRRAVKIPRDNSVLSNEWSLHWQPRLSEWECSHCMPRGKQRVQNPGEGLGTLKLKVKERAGEKQASWAWEVNHHVWGSWGLEKLILFFIFFQVKGVIFNILVFVFGLWHSESHKLSSFLFCYVLDQSVAPNCWALMPVMLAIYGLVKTQCVPVAITVGSGNQSDMGFEYWPTLGKCLDPSEPQIPCL